MCGARASGRPPRQHPRPHHPTFLSQQRVSDVPAALEAGPAVMDAHVKINTTDDPLAAKLKEAVAKMEAKLEHVVVKDLH